ncbi:MAG: M50 family metallopeptidase [Actinomycetia bacterium]|nr:M50 family metallopeptidase [Actinomycetes bacterium]
MDSLLNAVSVIFWGLVMFSLIVVVHEAGHYTVARLCGMRVKEFMIGLPGPNIGFKAFGTKFGITPFLLGGYALIAGAQQEEQSPTLARSLGILATSGSVSGAAAAECQSVLGYDFESDLDQLYDWGTIERKRLKGDDCIYSMPADGDFAQGQPRTLSDVDALIEAERRVTYCGAPWFKRVLMLLAGAAFNLIFAIVVFSAALMYMGDTQPADPWRVEQVVAASPAATAGLQAGDQLLALDGQRFNSWNEFSALTATLSPGQEVVVSVLRGGQNQDFLCTLGDKDGKAFLGISPTTKRVPVSFGQAISRSVGFVGIVAGAIAQLFNPATFTTMVGQSSSVIGVSFEARNAASDGFLSFIVLAAALSISIGLMNLLPLPPLDGGKIVLETIQKLTRRALPVRVINIVSVGCLCLIVLLFVVLSGQDIQRYILGG